MAAAVRIGVKSGFRLVRTAEMLAPRRVCEKLRMHTSTFTSRGCTTPVGLSTPLSLFH